MKHLVKIVTMVSSWILITISNKFVTFLVDIGSYLPTHENIETFGEW